MRISTLLTLSLLLLAHLDTIAKAEEHAYRASLAKLPVAAESAEKGVMVDLLRLLGSATNSQISIDVYPFKRSLTNAIKGIADFHIPLIKPPHDPPSDFDYSTAPLFSVNFVLYTHKSSHLDINNLSQYTLSTDAAHTNLFDFKISPSYDIASALNMVASKRIDGYIFADVEADPVLRRLALKDIKRERFQLFHVHAVLPAGSKGKAADRMISKGMNIIRENGQWEQLMSPIYHEYIDWQP